MDDVSDKMTLTPYERVKKARQRKRLGLVAVQIGAGKDATRMDLPKPKVPELIKWISSKKDK